MQLLRRDALLCSFAYLRLRSFALFCVFLCPSAFRTTAFGNFRKPRSWEFWETHFGDSFWVSIVLTSRWPRHVDNYRPHFQTTVLSSGGLFSCFVSIFFYFAFLIFLLGRTLWCRFTMILSFVVLGGSSGGNETGQRMKGWARVNQQCAN